VHEDVQAVKFLADDEKDLNNTFLEQYDAIPINLFSPDAAEIGKIIT
jgi:hypothetical protein